MLKLVTNSMPLFSFRANKLTFYYELLAEHEDSFPWCHNRHSVFLYEASWNFLLLGEQ